MKNQCMSFSGIKWCEISAQQCFWSLRSWIYWLGITQHGTIFSEISLDGVRCQFSDAKSLSSLPQIPLFIPIAFVLGCVFMIIVSFWAAPFECLIGSGIILTGIPAYLLGYKWKKPHVVKKMLGECGLSAVCTPTSSARSITPRCESHVGISA